MKNMKKAEKHEMMRCPSCKSNTLYLDAEIKDLLRVCRCRKCGNDFYIWPADLDDKEAAELIRKYLEKEIPDEARSAHKVNVAMQMAKDVADIAASEVFGMGEGRAEKWSKVYSKILNDMMRMIASDNEDDPEIVFSKAKVDERLRQIYGKNFQPWEVRYNE